MACRSLRNEGWLACNSRQEEQRCIARSREGRSGAPVTYKRLEKRGRQGAPEEEARRQAARTGLQPAGRWGRQKERIAEEGVVPREVAWTARIWQ